MTRQDLIAALWHGRDPSANPPKTLRPLDLQGGRSIHRDVIHLDAGHDEASVAADLRAWWPVLRSGGLLIADDHDNLGGCFPGVIRAVDAFCAEVGVEGLWPLWGKCNLIKTTQSEVFFLPRRVIFPRCYAYDQ